RSLPRATKRSRPFKRRRLSLSLIDYASPTTNQGDRLMWKVNAALIAVAMLATNARADEPQVGHMVYFQLKDASAAEKKKLVDACKKYLKEHDGVVYFAAGAIADELKREVNDRDWDVALHLVFKDKASHDKYQDAKTHKQFIDENKDNWK